MVGLGEDEFFRYVNQKEKPELNEFKGGPRLAHTAYLMLTIIYCIIFISLIIILPIYAYQNPNNFDSVLSIILHGFVMVIILLLLSPFFYIISILITLKTYMIDLTTSVFINEDSIIVNEDIYYFLERKLSIPISNIKNISFYKDMPILYKFRYLLLRRLLFFLYRPKGSFYSPLISTAGIVILELHSPMLYPTRKKKNGKPIMDTTQRIMFEIRKKDQKRFLSLINKSKPDRIIS